MISEYKVIFFHVEEDDISEGTQGTRPACGQMDHKLFKEYRDQEKENMRDEMTALVIYSA